VNIAFVTTRLFERPASGGELCTARLQQALRSMGHRLQLAGCGRAPTTLAAEAPAWSLGPWVAPFETLTAAQQAAAVLRAAWRRRAVTVDRLHTAGGGQRGRRALQTLAAGAPDALVIDHLMSWSWFDGGPPPAAPVMLVMHNLESEGFAERAASASQPGLAAALRRAVLARETLRLRQLEDAALRAAAVVACLNPKDAECLRRRLQTLGTQAFVQVLPGYPMRGPRATRPPGTRTVGMLGTWTWAPNRAALDWMLSAVWPSLRADCQLVLAGTGLDRLTLPDGVRSLGRLDDVGAFYDAVDLVALCARSGSGVQEKAIEAVASGRAVVATAKALQGLEGALPPQVSKAHDARQFAVHCRAALAAPPDSEAASEAARAWGEQRQRDHAQALQRCLQALGTAPSVRASAAAR
jgi:hypothetical protein